MDEGILIEIEQRFRLLERDFEAADRFLIVAEKYHDREARNYGQSDSQYAQKQCAFHGERGDSIRASRESIKSSMELCWEDIEMMQNEIRRASGSLSGKPLS